MKALTFSNIKNTRVTIAMDDEVVVIECKGLYDEKIINPMRKYFNKYYQKQSVSLKTDSFIKVMVAFFCKNDKKESIKLYNELMENKEINLKIKME